MPVRITNWNRNKFVPVANVADPSFSLLSLILNTYRRHRSSYRSARSPGISISGSSQIWRTRTLFPRRRSKMLSVPNEGRDQWSRRILRNDARHACGACYRGLCVLPASGRGAARPHFMRSATAYAKEACEAFGRPIGGFQSILPLSNRCAGPKIEGCQTLFPPSALACTNKGRGLSRRSHRQATQACSMFRKGFGAWITGARRLRL